MGYIYIYIPNRIKAKLATKKGKKSQVIPINKEELAERRTFPTHEVGIRTKVLQFSIFLDEFIVFSRFQ